MVGGTSFHCEILKASFGRVSKSNGKNKSNGKSFLTSKKQNLRLSAASTASLTSDTLRVS
jgi:hypothetical protein